MSQIFKQNEDYAKMPRRNNFDLSFSNNFTTGFGRITPILCKDVNSGETFRIKSSIGLRALPLAFPIQTPVRVQVSFFYQRLRNLQRNWMDFYCQTKDIEIPYISIPVSRAAEIGTGTLADYLGVPTTYADDSGTDLYPLSIRGSFRPEANTAFGDTEYHYAEDSSTMTNSNFSLNYNPGDTQFSPTANLFLYGGTYGVSLGSQLNPNGYKWLGTQKTNISLSGEFRFFCSSNVPSSIAFSFLFSVENPDNPGYHGSTIVNYKGLNMTYDNTGGYYYGSFSQSDLDDITQSLGSNSFYITFGVNNQFDIVTECKGNQLIVGRRYVKVTDISPLNNPFVIQSGESVPDIKLCAYPFRCYESIYNAYYRNSNGVDPFILNGQEEYNRYCTNLGDGADSTTPLNIYYRNYELDAFTSCYKTPQLGDAALVGVSSTGKFTFEDSTGQTFTVTPTLGPDGNTLTGIDSYSENTPIGSLTRLRDLISYGISINDFRNVSHFQRFMENALRRGLRYAEVVKSHSGTNLKYKSVDLPEYIGGYTRNLNVKQITATADTEQMQLGDYRGQAGLFSNSEHSIVHYCDEPGYIMGLITIVPIPCYSQMLDTKFIKDNLLSFHFPEFNGIGLQPIDYRVVAPIQAKVQGKEYTDTFGYQRPWWDLIASYDEVHGKFRTDFQGFLITRNFTQAPELNGNFLKINPNEMTNPFIDENDNEHTFMGQVTFDIKAKRPIPRIHIPTL